MGNAGAEFVLECEVGLRLLKLLFHTLGLSLCYETIHLQSAKLLREFFALMHMLTVLVVMLFIGDK